MSSPERTLRSFFACGALGVAVAAGGAREAHAAGFSFGGFSFDPNSLVSDDVIKQVVTTFGFGGQHRPYEPATPLGIAVGLDFSLEVTLFKVPDSFFDALAAAGLPFPGSALPALPVAKLHLHKGFGDWVDIGGSAFYLTGYKIFGGDVKIALNQAEEGPSYAFRFCYTYLDIVTNGINISTKTLAPQLLASRRMDFADPYLGVAFEYTTGAVDATVTVPTDLTGPVPAGLTIPPVSLHKESNAYGGYLFGGVSLRIPRSGLRITVEGAYDTAGVSTMGTKVGFTF